MGKPEYILTYQKKLKPPAEVRLTVRETEILTLLMLGFWQTEISKALFISVHTVKTHIKHMFDKTGTDNAMALVVYALLFQLINPEAVKTKLHARLIAQAQEELNDAA